MATSLKMAGRFFRAGIRGLAWLCLLLLTVLTLFLFTETGQSFPKAFRSWEEIGFIPDRINDQTHSTPRFLCMSRCGRYFCTVDFFRASARIETDFTIRRWPGGALLCTIPNNSDHPNSLLVSKDEQWIAMRSGERSPVLLHSQHSRTFGYSNWQIYRKDGTKWLKVGEAKSIDFPANGQSMLIATERKVQVKSMANELIKEVDFDPSHVVAFAFFNANGNPKAVVFEGNEATTDIGSRRFLLGNAKRLESDEEMDQAVDHHNETECWDIATGRREWMIQGLRAKLLPSDPSRLVWAASVRNHPDSLRFYSLADGRMLRNHSIWGDVKSTPAELLCLSQNGEYFVFYHWHPGDLPSFNSSASFMNWINAKCRWLERMIPGLAESVSMTLVDTRSGKTWKIGKARDAQKSFWSTWSFLNTCPINACFHENKQLLTVFDDDGAYDWDLPPRTRWFTPWAWAALAAWLAMIWFLAPWRILRRRPMASRPSVVRS